MKKVYQDMCIEVVQVELECSILTGSVTDEQPEVDNVTVGGYEDGGTYEISFD